MRFTKDATPPNQRRLAKNDALVELIQTTEYLEDTPMWGQRDYCLYPLGMVIPSIEEEEEVEVEEDEWLNERPVERSNGGLGRGFSCGMEEKLEETYMK